MNIELYSDAVLTRDIPAHDLLAGDVVKVVDRHPSENDASGYSIEVFNTLGDTVAVTSVNACDLEPLLADEVFSVRKISVVA